MGDWNVMLQASQDIHTSPTPCEGSSVFASWKGFTASPVRRTMAVCTWLELTQANYKKLRVIREHFNTDTLEDYRLFSVMILNKFFSDSTSNLVYAAQRILSLLSWTLKQCVSLKLWRILMFDRHSAVARRSRIIVFTSRNRYKYIVL